MPPKKAATEEELPRFGRVKANLKMGIVGLPNVGKSSLFNLLSTTNAAAAAENFPFCTIEPNDTRCAVPDDRYEKLCEIWDPPSKYPAYLHLVDIAGLIKGAAEGAGLGNAFLSHIQSVDGIYHVIRAFDNDEVLHVEDSIDPVRDLETITHELCAKDLSHVRRLRLDVDKEIKSKPKEATKMRQDIYPVFDKWACRWLPPPLPILLLLPPLPLRLWLRLRLLRRLFHRLLLLLSVKCAAAAGARRC